MSKKNCVISAVGKDSLHKCWVQGPCDFDLHLIVYDDSIDMFENDTQYICQAKGYKLKLVYWYLLSNPQYLDSYDYFFIPDDDVLMSSGDINNLFTVMRKYKLKIAQPSLAMSYYSWPHTLRSPFCILRYTNLIEMMVPCFSREALLKVLDSFNANSTGWGVEAHWPLLINSSHRDMAVIDSVSVVHTRPIQSGQSIHYKEMYEYFNKYHLTNAVYEYAYLTVKKSTWLSREKYNGWLNDIESWIKNTNFATVRLGLDGSFGYVLQFWELACMTNDKKLLDLSQKLLAHTYKYIGHLQNKMVFEDGITGCCWLILYLSDCKFIDSAPQKILEKIMLYLDGVINFQLEKLSVQELVGIGLYVQSCIKYYNQVSDKEKLHTVALKLVHKLYKDINEVNAMTLLGSLVVLKNTSIACNNLIETLLEKSSKVKSSVIRMFVYYTLYKLTNDSELLNKIKNFGGKLVTIDSSFLEVLLGTTLVFCALQDLSLCDNRILRKDNTIL